MAIYIYRCPNGHEEEYRCKISETRPDGFICSECYSWMTRVPAAGSFILKGDGWGKSGYSKRKNK